MYVPGVTSTSGPPTAAMLYSALSFSPTHNKFRSGRSSTAATSRGKVMHASTLWGGGGQQRGRDTKNRGSSYVFPADIPLSIPLPMLRISRNQPGPKTVPDIASILSASQEKVQLLVRASCLLRRAACCFGAQPPLPLYRPRPFNRHQREFRRAMTQTTAPEPTFEN